MEWGHCAVHGVDHISGCSACIAERDLATERALRQKRERQIEKLERLCSKESNHLIFGPSGVGCWEIDDEDGDSWLESDTFTGLLAAIDEATGEKR